MGAMPFIGRAHLGAYHVNVEFFLLIDWSLTCVSCDTMELLSPHRHSLRYRVCIIIW